MLVLLWPHAGVVVGIMDSGWCGDSHCEVIFSATSSPVVE